MSEGNEILIKPRELREAATVLRESSKKVQASIDEVDQQIQSLGPDRFEGMAADAIRARYARMRQTFYSFKPMVEKVGQKLEQIATEFEIADKTASR